MQLIESQLAAAIAERNRIEAEAWSRALETPYPSERKEVLPYLPALEGLMVPPTRARWRAVNIAIDEMAKYLP